MSLPSAAAQELLGSDPPAGLRAAAQIARDRYAGRTQLKADLAELFDYAAEHRADMPAGVFSLIVRVARAFLVSG